MPDSNKNQADITYVVSQSQLASSIPLCASDSEKHGEASERDEHGHEGNGRNTPTVITSNGGGATASFTVAENTSTPITTVVGTADRGEILTYSIVGGVDASKFTIDSKTGALSFISPPDFERATDVGANNVYNVVVKVFDGKTSDTQALAVTVTDVNEAPVITSGATVNVAENATAVTTVTASDPNAGAVLSYSIAGGADAAKFAINPSTGALSFVSAPNFEAPTDAGANNVYNVTVQTSDGSNTASQAITVTVTDVNDNAPQIISNGGGATSVAFVDENTNAVTTVQAVDADAGTVLTYSISGNDAAKFTINSLTGALSFITPPDFENPTDIAASNVYDVVVQASDGLHTTSQGLVIAVANVNDVPTQIISNGGGDSASITVAENSSSLATATPLTTVIGTAEVGETPNYTIVGGADAGYFFIHPQTGQLFFTGSGPDYDFPGDADGNNVFEVIVQVFDGTTSDTQAISVTLTGVNDLAPQIFIPPSDPNQNINDPFININVDENSSTVATVTATDRDLAPTVLTFSIAGGADASKFTIDPSTGALKFVTSPDFEAPASSSGNNIYDVVLQVSDGLFTSSKETHVFVRDTNDNSPVIVSNGGGVAASVSVTENSTVVSTVAATDADVGTLLNYSIFGGADASKFTIQPNTGALSFISAPNFEAPTDIGANNVYDVVVGASDGVNTDTQVIAVTVTNLNDNAPVINSNGGGATASVSIPENSTAVTTVSATDADVGAILTYAIAGGADASKFTINSTTGALSFISTPNFEAPADVGLNNVYDVVVSASDGLNIDTQAIAVAVTNVNDNAPVINSNGGGATASVSIPENSTAVTTVSATDADVGAILTYAIAGGSDASNFTINSTTGALSFISAPNFEAPTDAGLNNVYDVVVSASDGVNIDTQAIAVTVTDVVEAISPPVIVSNGGGATAAISIPENSTVVTTVVATDAGSNLTYFLGGTDAARFTLNSVTGVLSFISPPNFEAPTDAGLNNVYDIQVSASGVGGFDSQNISVTVTDVVEADPFPPIVGLTFFTEPLTGNSIISIGFNEAVTGSSLAGLTVTRNPVNGEGGTPIAITGFSGLGTNTIVLTTTSPLIGNDIIKLHYDAAVGNLTDLAGNRASSADVFVGGSGGNVIDMSNHASSFVQILRGNGGADLIIGSSNADIISDGSGTDTVIGGLGADLIRMGENGLSPAIVGNALYAQDVVKIGVGESTTNGFDQIAQTLTNPAGTGFDIASANIANHDILNLQSQVIAADVSNVSDNGAVNVGLIKNHSISNGIVTFYDADTGGNAIAIDANNAQSAMSYLSSNIVNPGTTVAFKMDTNGVPGADSLMVFQDNGIFASGLLAAPDTAVLMTDMVNVNLATLGTTAGANVVQIQDTTGPIPLNLTTNASGVHMAFSENAFSPADASSITLFQNGTTAMGPVTISGSGTGVIDLQTSTALAPNDWVLMHYQPTSAASSFTDVLGNAYSAPAGGVNLAIGNLQSNTINLSGLGLTSGATLIGNSGADILVGTNQSDVVWGGPGADTMTGGAGTDSFVFYQGDTPGISSFSVGAGGTPGVFGNGDAFTLNNGFDRITDFSSGEVITFQSPLDFNLPNPTSIGPGFPANGFLSDNSFYTVQGNLVGNVFTVNSTTGTDTLVVYDSSTTALQITTLVLSGVTPAQLNLSAGSNVITHNGTATPIIDTTAPTNLSASFNEIGTPVISLGFDEAVNLPSTAGLTLTLNPLGGVGGTAMAITSIGGSGSTTLSLGASASPTLLANDFVKIRYDASIGNLTDLSGNEIISQEIYAGGSGANTINLLNSSSTFRQILRGNSGDDTLTGTQNSDTLIDGGGKDILTGSRGADTIVLTESVSSGAQFQDIVKIGLGDSTATAISTFVDTIQGATSNPFGSGFDISSATVANHDILNLQSQVIAADVIHANGTDVGAIAQHSISNGIVTFENASGAALLIDSSNRPDAFNYLRTNITTAGTTVAYKIDIDNSGAVDTLVVFQDNGKLASGADVADTVVAMTNLVGIDNAILGTAAGANVVQLQDTTGPRTVDFVTTSDGIHLYFAESAFLGTTVQSQNLKNGSVIMTTTSVDNDGSASITVHTNQTLAATDWVLQKFNATDPTNGSHDASGNTNVSPVGGLNVVRGGDGDNTIDLSGLAALANVNGNAGNDVIIGSNFGDTLMGGAGADTMTGGAGNDSFVFFQGDSPSVTATNLGLNGILDNGDAFTFANGVDRVTDYSIGDTLNIFAPDNSNLPFPSWMGATPSNGQASNSGFFMVQGNYNGTTTFTVDNTTGTDSLIVYDGNSSTSVTQSAIVLSGVTLAQLLAQTGNHFVAHI